MDTDVDMWLTILVLQHNFDHAEATTGAKPAPPEMHFVQHWSEELKRLVPSK